MKSHVLRFGACLALGGLLASSRAGAVLLPLDGSWSVFGERPDSNGGFAFGETWTFESKTPVRFDVADIYVPGDVYQVFLNGELLGETGAPDARFSGAWTDSPDEAVLDTAFSHAGWLLDPGTYEVTIQTQQRPSLFANQAGTLGLRLEPVPVAVPEGRPAIAMFGLVLLGLAALRRGCRLHGHARQKAK